MAYQMRPFPRRFYFFQSWRACLVDVWTKDSFFFKEDSLDCFFKTFSPLSVYVLKYLVFSKKENFKNQIKYTLKKKLYSQVTSDMLVVSNDKIINESSYLWTILARLERKLVYIHLFSKWTKFKFKLILKYKTSIIMHQWTS